MAATPWTGRLRAMLPRRSPVVRHPQSAAATQTRRALCGQRLVAVSEIPQQDKQLRLLAGRPTPPVGLTPASLEVRTTRQAGILCGLWRDSNTASGNYSWIPGGYYGTLVALRAPTPTPARDGRQLAIRRSSGRCRGSTTDATRSRFRSLTRLAHSRSWILPANSTLLVTALVVARDTSGNSAGWRAEALFKRDSSNNTSRLGPPL